MTWIRIKLISFAILLSMTNATAEVVKIKYKVRKKESLAQIYKKFITLDHIIHNDQDFVQFTLNQNEGIENWHSIDPGKTITLYLDKNLMKERVQRRYEKEKATPYSAKLARAVASQSKSTFTKKLETFSGKTSFSLFYLASSGVYTQNTGEEDINIDLNQDSPASFGGLISHKFRQHWSFSTSLYYSQFDEAIFNGETTTVPDEYGGNGYLYYSGMSGIGLFGGIDYEQLTSYNLQNLIDNQILSFDTHKMGYLTTGIDFLKTISDKLFLLKFAVSYSVFSSTSSDFVEEGKDFKGIRYLAYLNLPISKNVFLHGLAKYHDLQDTESMQILRLGFGGGFRF